MTSKQLPTELDADPRWTYQHKLAFLAGFCTVEPDGSPHLERPDADDLAKFVMLVIEPAIVGFGGDACDFAESIRDQVEEKK